MRWRLDGANASRPSRYRRLPAADIRGTRPGFGRRQRVAVLQQLDRDAVGRAHERHLALARRPVDGDAVRDQRVAGVVDIVDGIVYFKALRFIKDDITGLPHIEANFTHWRPAGAWQRESQFSDGTLRLIGLLWSLMDGSSLLLIEEPELSLNEEIVRHLPRLIQQVQKQSRTPRQVFITTHSEALLSDGSIPAEEVIRLAPGREGTRVHALDKQEKIMLASGLSVGEVLLRTTQPENVGQLEFSLR